MQLTRKYELIKNITDSGIFIPHGPYNYNPDDHCRILFIIHQIYQNIKFINSIQENLLILKL